MYINIMCTDHRYTSMCIHCVLYCVMIRLLVYTQKATETTMVNAEADK